MDPWGCKINKSDVSAEFEDNFRPEQKFEKLNDSAEYLSVLGKLNNIVIFTVYFFITFKLLIL